LHVCCSNRYRIRSRAGTENYRLTGCVRRGGGAEHKSSQEEAIVTVHPTFPGVYVQEVPSGVRTIMGVGTSTALFIGQSALGPMNSPVRCLTYTDFVRAFSDDTSVGSLANYVKLFFLNGGTDCYIMRIANGATNSSVKLKNESGTTEVLELTAKDPGVAGEQIRAAVTYNGVQPEITFNLDLFRWAVDAAGNRTKQGAESFKNLSMDPDSQLYAVDVITQNSKFVSAKLPGGALTSVPGFSLSGLSGPFTAFAGPLTGANFQISIGGSPFVNVVLPSPAMTLASAPGLITTAINTGFTNLTLTPPPFTVTFTGTGSNRRLRIDAGNLKDDVLVRNGASPDMCVPLMMGTANGGLEVGAYATLRPAASGIVFPILTVPGALDNLAAMAPTGVGLDMQNANGTFTAQTIPIAPVITASDRVADKLATIANSINSYQATGSATSKWRAEIWGLRLALIPTDVDDNYVGSLPTVTPAADPLTSLPFLQNVHYYSLGISGLGSAPAKQTPAASIASDGGKPLASDYDTAYPIIDKEVDLFNLMVLPPDASVSMDKIYPNASVFCQQRRAFLLMDAPPGWSGAQQAVAGVAALRIGLVKDYSALFYPRLTIDDKGLRKFVGPSGAIAGLCARIDGTRGVWKAPAGTEADLRGILGVEQRFTDGENGILNPRAVNTIRVFPSGIVNWGARTFDGDDDFASEYKYIPIRRLALFMEESLYRGLKWVVFEPNDEPLYSQIRLNVGSFMHDLFRQGAFQGGTPKDAYFVKCDRETTTQSDRNQGIVNIWVGFAPLKPAEFVILYLQQMAGQIQV
jgi:uncharacterized protein